MVNIDFFKDLLEVLRSLVSRTNGSDAPGGTDEKDEEEELDQDVRAMYHRLQCIVTAFELLSGQGLCTFAIST